MTANRHNVVREIEKEVADMLREGAWGAVGLCREDLAVRIVAFVIQELPIPRVSSSPIGWACGPAQAIEAQRGETVQQGSTGTARARPEGCAHTPQSSGGDK